MTSYTFTEDNITIGMHVPSFPDGIKEAFESLLKNLGGRDYYGISWMEGDTIQYYAMAKQQFAGEAEPYHYASLIIAKGEYRTEKVLDWPTKTDCIKDVFHRLMGPEKPGKNHPCIEWYYSEQEMLCMVKV